MTCQQTDVEDTGSRANEGKRPRRTQHEPPMKGELEHARTRLRTAKTTKALANNIRVPTLVALYHELEIPIDNPKRPKKKIGLVELIGKWVRTSYFSSTIADCNPIAHRARACRHGR